MLMNNLLECTDNYFITLGSLWNYYRDEMNDDANENKGDNCKVNNEQEVSLLSIRQE